MRREGAEGFLREFLQITKIIKNTKRECLDYLITLITIREAELLQAWLNHQISWDPKLSLLY